MYCMYGTFIDYMRGKVGLKPEKYNKEDLKYSSKRRRKFKMIRKVAILANGGDVSGFNAVIRAIVKTAENNGIDCYGFIDGYNGLLKNNYEKLSTANDEHASGILQKGGSIIGSSTNANVFHYKD